MLYNSGSVELKKQKNAFIEEINERGKISKAINQYMTVLEHTNLTFFENKEKNKTKTKKDLLLSGRTKINKIEKTISKAMRPKKTKKLLFPNSG